MKTFLNKIAIVLTVLFVFTSCYDEIEPEIPVVEVKDELKINTSYGIKLESTFVTNEVSMNVKLDTAGLKIYTTALPSSAYRIALYKSNVMLGITDFNKIN